LGFLQTTQRYVLIFRVGSCGRTVGHLKAALLFYKQRHLLVLTLCDII